MNNAISDRFGLQKGKMEPLAHSRQWPSVARAAGFKSVLLCKDQDKKARVCRSLSKATNDWSLAETQPPEFYRVFGEQEGYLILSLNDHFDFKL